MKNVILSINAVCSGGTNLALPIWAIAAIIVGGLLLLGTDNRRHQTGSILAGIR